MYLEELTSYKQKLLKALCNSEDIINLIDVNNSALDGCDTMYKQIFPYGYIPDVQTEQSVYICFDVEIPRVSNKLFKDVAIHLYVLSHKNHMVTTKGTRLDLIAERIDKLINGSKDYGFGLDLVWVKRFMPAEDYYGVELYYEALDRNGGCDNRRK